MSLFLTTTALTFSLFVLAPFSTNPSMLIQHPLVTQEQDCFHESYSEYDLWVEHTRQRFKQAYHAETAVDKSLALFKSRYSKEKFDTYKKLTCRTFSYDVDGVPVQGYVIKPKHMPRSLPVVIFNRGGNGNFGGVRFLSMFKTLFPIAEQGFVIFGSQYRGTFSDKIDSKYGFQGYYAKQPQDEFGGKDIQDVIRLIDYIPSIVGVDPKRIGLFGWSRGGMQSYLVLKQVENIKAVVTVAGNSDLLAGLSQRPDMERVYKKRIPNYQQNKTSELEKRSVIKWVDKLPTNVPILLLHGSDDRRVDVSHSIILADKLKQHNLSHKLVVYDRDDHGLTHNKEQANQEIVSWFKQHL
ncbi:S9 family peptidase [Shewanella sp. MBTL60-007]|uniref:alpha/beta hydrolase family protein n=1 Tax=Shewanella sp. MBTL60-007 TaxID=2815911 RepID=UPI001BBBCCC2|nr:prolyl oligopeptidase family serine peptidase [Shewanella sp. MBTL60-007]GIU15344.1 peptidase [Shewanella sp. MBTL60-007]